MNNQKRGLSRGLDALLSIKSTIKNSATTNQTNDNNLVKFLNTNELLPGQFQPRRIILTEELEELKNSINNQGVLQPLIVRKRTDEQYEIIAGERRWRAAQLAGLKEIPVIIKNVNDQNALTIALIENIQRTDLNPLEEAIALDRLSKEFNLTHADLAIALGRSRVAITNLLRILQLPVEIKNLLEQKQLDLGHAKVILSAPNNLQIALANKIIAEKLSVRATELLLQKHLSTSNRNQPLANKNDLQTNPDLIKLQQKISDLLGAKVSIITNKNQRAGKLVIQYNDLDELEGILNYINIT